MKHAALLCLLAGPVFADAPPIPRFAPETGGILHSYQGDWEQVVGGGVAAFDCSSDALPDLFFTGGTAPASLWVNETPRGGPLAFRSQTSGAELDLVSGAWPMDVDSDGITDLALMRVGENVLMRGLGDCRFERANELWGFQGLDGWSTAFAATWEQGRAFPTLAVGNYVNRLEEAFPWGSCTENWLHRGTEAGFEPALPLTPSFCPLSILFTDWSRQGRPDLRVSNDREYYKGGQEQLWHLPHDAPPRLYSEAEGWQRLRIWGMGIAGHDLDFDGYPEYALTSMADNKLQVLADPSARPLLPRYRDDAFKRNSHAQRPHTGGDVRPSTAWHVQFEDVNNDGRADLFMAKGNVSTMPDFAADDPNNLLLQQADGRFVEAAAEAGVASMRPGRGGAVLDLNDDGWLDLVVVNRNAPVEVWRNLGHDGAGNWIAIDPRQPAPNIHAVNGWAEVRANGVTQRREITVGGGHGSGQVAPQHFGLGAADRAEVRMIWPDGTTSDWVELAAGKVWLVPKSGTPAPW